MVFSRTLFGVELLDENISYLAGNGDFIVDTNAIIDVTHYSYSLQSSMKISELFIELSKLDIVMPITVALDIFAIAWSSSIFESKRLLLKTFQFFLTLYFAKGIKL